MENMEYDIRQLIRRRDFQAQEAAITQDVARYKRILARENYCKEDQLHFTPAQEAEVRAFWKPYSFLYDFDPASIEPFYSLSGIFDPRYIPLEFMEIFLRRNFVPESYRMALQDKALLSKMLPDFPQPFNVVKKVEGIYYTQDFHRITLDDAADACLACLNNGEELLYKPTDQTTGNGIFFLREATRDRIKQILSAGKSGMMQKAIRQSPEMSALNPTSVNTIRLVTFLLDTEVVPLACMIRVGSTGSRVDNTHRGGGRIGVHMDGSVLPFAYSNSYEKLTVLPSGAKLGPGGFERVPNFGKVLSLAIDAHYHLPYGKWVSWDIALDENNEPLIIECNFFGAITSHQALTGPVFGPYTEKVLSIYGPNLYRPGMDEYFDYNEYVGHVKITKYWGVGRSYVDIPATFHGKPVRAIGKSAFAGNREIETVCMSPNTRVVQTRAFANCRSLKKIEGKNPNLRFAESSFAGCPNPVEQE